MKYLVLLTPILCLSTATLSVNADSTIELVENNPFHYTQGECAEGFEATKAITDNFSILGN